MNGIILHGRIIPDIKTKNKKQNFRMIFAEAMI